MKALFRSIAIKLSYIIAIAIIITAIFVSVARLLTPFLDQHHADVEKWASNLLHTPVTINNVEISWYQYQPEITLNQTTILKADTKKPILQIQKMRIFFSLPKSLWQGKLVPSGIMISGADITLNQSKDGDLTVEEFSSLRGLDQPYKSEAKLSDLVGWLLMQPRLTLHDIDVRYHDFSGQKRFVTLYKLSLINSDTKHLLYGKAILHQAIPTEVTLALQWQGQGIDLSQIKGKAYLYVSGLSLSQWLKGATWNKWQINGGLASAKIWGTWDHGAFQAIQTTLQAYSLNLYSETDKSKHLITRLSGNFGWKRDGRNQVVAADDMLVDLPTHLWPITNFYVVLSPDTNGALSPKAATFGYIDLNDVQSFLFSSPQLISPDSQKMLALMQLKGYLQNANIVFSGPEKSFQQVSFNADFGRLSFKPWQQFPGVNNLAGRINWNGPQALGDLSIHSARTLISYDSVFAKPLYLEELSGTIQGSLNASHTWTIKFPSIHALNSDIDAVADGTVIIPENASAVADLNAKFSMPNARMITNYLPLKKFDPEVSKWLQQAFTSGEISSANVKLQGPLNDFPFDQQNGTFQISGDLKDVGLRYAPNWPLAQHINGKITFSGRQMTLNVDQAKLLNVPLTNVSATLPAIGNGEQVLTLQSDKIETDFTQLINFAQHTPFDKSMEKMFASVKLLGPMTMKLGLTLPLNQLEKTQVQGSAGISDGQIHLIPSGLAIDHVNGELHFTEKNLEAPNLQAELFNKPIQVSIATTEKNAKPVVEAQFSGNLNVEDLEKWLKTSFSQVVSGKADVKGAITLAANSPVEVKLNSDLVGMSVNLPDQYAKDAQTTRDFSADFYIEENQPLRVKMAYGGLLNVAAVLDRKENQFKLVSADLRLGRGNAVWPTTPGLFITGNFDQLDWDKIKGYTNSSSESHFSLSQLQNIDIYTKSLKIFGQELSQVRLQAEPTHDNWNISISSRDIAGKIEFPLQPNLPQASMTVRLDRLNLPSISQFKSDSVIDVKGLPSISFIANNVSYNDIPVGQVSFKTSPNEKGLHIQQLKVLSPRMDLRASGDWVQKNNGATTQLKGTIASTRISDLINSLKFDAHNFVSSSGNVDFNLSWDDAPYAFSVGSLNGTITIRLGQGRIVEVSNGAMMDIGRMLNIFSLSTIPRRLAFDFSDLSQKGYSFDSFEGDFNLRRGNAYTTKAVFDGPVAGVGMNGRIGLKEKDYDITISVTPHVTSSIPIAATLLTVQPLVGVAAWAVDRMISSQIFTYHYTVKGPWNNPAWENVAVSKK